MQKIMLNRLAYSELSISQTFSMKSGLFRFSGLSKNRTLANSSKIYYYHQRFWLVQTKEHEKLHQKMSFPFQTMDPPRGKNRKRDWKPAEDPFKVEQLDHILGTFAAQNRKNRILRVRLPLGSRFRQPLDRFIKLRKIDDCTSFIKS